MFKIIIILAVLNIASTCYSFSRAPFLIGESINFTPVRILLAAINYLLGLALAWSLVIFIQKADRHLRPIGVLVLASLTATVYGFIFIQLFFNVGRTITYTPAYIGYSLAFFTLGFALALTTILSYKKLKRLKIR